MARATKKALNEALKPLFREYDRFALGLLTGGKRVPKPEPIEWGGYKIDISVIRRARVVCNVPAPFSLVEFHYEAFRDGVRVVSWPGRPSFIDALFRYSAKNNIDMTGAA